MENRSVFSILLLLVVALTLGADEPPKPKVVFSSLKVGQSVTMKDEGPNFSISFFDEEVPLAHKVIEIGDDFIVVQNIADLSQTSIPVYSLKAITKVQTKGVSR